MLIIAVPAQHLFDELLAASCHYDENLGAVTLTLKEKKTDGRGIFL